MLLHVFFREVGGGGQRPPLCLKGDMIFKERGLNFWGLFILQQTENLENLGLEI